MLQSQLFARSKKEFPKEAESISHQLLWRGDYIEQVAAGVYILLPLGWRVVKKIEQIIRTEMNALGAQELALSVLQPKALWQETGRWETYVPPLFKLKDQHGRELALAPTHEEMVTALVRRRVHSYKDLPLALYQIQTKFRNEVRAAGGLLRGREFLMKDLYSFHATDEDFAAFYQKVQQAYLKIFERCGLAVKMVEAATGSIGGTLSHEFMFLAETGEDTVAVCSKCEFAANTELVGQAPKCPKCGAAVRLVKAIEGSHIFKLGDLYSKKMGALFTDEKGERRPIIMGCYGLGLGRLMATIVEAHRESDSAIEWPASVAPFDAHIIMLAAENEAVKKAAFSLAAELAKRGQAALLDDRPALSAGVKFAEADLIGVPRRFVVSEKTLKSQGVEARDGFKAKPVVISPAQALDLF